MIVRVARCVVPQAAFKVLENMGSVTNFSVANSVKRGVVVFLGAAAMGTPVGLLPTVGAAVAVLGTAAYWVRLLFARYVCSLT